MLWYRVRKLFKNWKLYEKESFFDTVIFYEHDKIKLERRFKPEEKHKLHELLLNLYYEFERDWMHPLSNREIALLLWVDHQTVNNLMIRLKARMRSKYENFI